jgi:hypothetical protein
VKKSKLLIIVLIVAFFAILVRSNYGLRQENARLQTETDVIGAAMMKLKDENEGYKKERLWVATQILEPESFVTLEPGTAELTFHNFKGDLRWFAQSPGDTSSVSYYQLNGPKDVGVVLKGTEKGDVVSVPEGARAYLLKGTPTSKDGYTVDHFSK